MQPGATNPPLAAARSARWTLTFAFSRLRSIRTRPFRFCAFSDIETTRADPIILVHLFKIVPSQTSVSYYTRRRKINGNMQAQQIAADLNLVMTVRPRGPVLHPPILTMLPMLSMLSGTRRRGRG